MKNNKNDITEKKQKKEQTKNKITNIEKQIANT